jgi:hypothetical protein
MAIDTLKFGLYNVLAESDVWDDDPANVVKPFVVTIDAGTTKKYTNPELDANAELIPLLYDGDQNLPIFFTDSPAQIKIDCGAGCSYAPAFIAIINHNCNVHAADKIEIYYSDNDADWTLAEAIDSPDRAVDRFYAMRQNDVWYNSTPEAHRYFRVDLHKNAGGAYIGELFVCPQNFGLLEWDPQPDYGMSFDLMPRDSVAELVSGAPVVYKVRPEMLGHSFANSRKVFQGVDRRISHPAQIAAAMQRGQYKQVMIWPNLEITSNNLVSGGGDVICEFGKFAPSGSLGWTDPDESQATSYQWAGEWPMSGVSL